MRKLIALSVAVTLLLVPGTASAGKKKAKPYQTETVTIAAGHPVFNSASGTVLSLTAQEFIASCAVPSSNGLDAYVFEVPADYQKINASLDAIGSSPSPAGYDVDVYLFDPECTQTQALNVAGTDESGSMLKGTAFMLVHNYLPGPLDVQITLKPL